MITDPKPHRDMVNISLNCSDLVPLVNVSLSKHSVFACIIFRIGISRLISISHKVWSTSLESSNELVFPLDFQPHCFRAAYLPYSIQVLRVKAQTPIITISSPCWRNMGVKFHKNFPHFLTPGCCSCHTPSSPHTSLSLTNSHSAHFLSPHAPVPPANTCPRACTPAGGSVSRTPVTRGLDSALARSPASGPPRVLRARSHLSIPGCSASAHPPYAHLVLITHTPRCR